MRPGGPTGTFRSMKPGDALADYTITDLLAGDGTTRVYGARPPERLGLAAQRVAVKVRPGGDDQAFRRFSRELKMYARVADPGLLTVYDAGQHDTVFFYTTEWCEGGSLDTAASLPRAVRLRALARAARAVHALHEAGIVHRDIRPATILLRSDQTAVLADLGAAHVGTATMTSMAPMASVGFVDPQLLMGEAATRSTDVFSLGATLHRVLTGQHLHPHLDGGDVLLALRTVLSQSARIDRAALSADEADVVAACVDRRAEARPPTAEAFAHLVDDLVERAP